jgi:hypothetical protein
MFYSQICTVGKKVSRYHVNSSTQKEVVYASGLIKSFFINYFLKNTFTCAETTLERVAISIT